VKKQVRKCNLFSFSCIFDISHIDTLDLYLQEVVYGSFSGVPVAQVVFLVVR
jgi:hypothetical protein